MPELNGMDKQRKKMQLYENGTLKLTRIYVHGTYEKETTAAGTREIHYINTGAGVSAFMEKKGTTLTMYYLHSDHLGSITMITNQSGAKVEELNYDAWGRMRDPATWVPYAPGQEPDLMIAGRGFTGHEHLKWFKFINMNGRMYDPLTGQFLSPDNYVQSPGFTQSFNRFGYCINNPLKYADPSGLTYFKLNEYWEWESFEYNPFQGGTPEFRQASHGGSNPERVNGTYRYNCNTGEYENNIGDIVSYTEVQNNYVLQKGDVLHSSSLLGSSVTSFYMDPHGSIAVSISYNNGSTSWFGVGGGKATGGMFFFGWDAVGNLVTTIGSFQYPSGGGGGTFNNIISTANQIGDWSSIGLYGPQIATDQKLNIKSRYQPRNYKPAVEAQVANGMKTAYKYLDYAGKALGVVSALDHLNKGINADNQWKAAGYFALTAFDVGLMFVKTTNPFVLGGIMLYNIVDATSF